MERYKESGNRNQLSFNLMSYEDMIDTENPVRAIDAIVLKMDISSLGFQYSKTASTGRPQNTYWALEPKHRKRAAGGGLFIAPTGWLRILRSFQTRRDTPFFQPVKPPVFNARKSA